jgi:hypothetical protein
MTDETEHDRPLEVARYDAFISYAREDNTAPTGFVVDRLREVLSTRGKQVWVDVRYIPGGADWRERIRRGIEACKAFMFIVSPDSVASEACRDELQAATELHKLVIPVVCRTPPPGTLPGPLAASSEPITSRLATHVTYCVGR